MYKPGTYIFPASAPAPSSAAKDEVDGDASTMTPPKAALSYRPSYRISVSNSNYTSNTSDLELLLSKYRYWWF